MVLTYLWCVSDLLLRTEKGAGISGFLLHGKATDIFFRFLSYLSQHH